MSQTSTPANGNVHSNTDTGQPPENRDARRMKRARRACLSCRARKVRCNVVEEDPCRNCRLDGVRCVVPRIRRNRKIFACLVPALTANAEVMEAEHAQQYRVSSRSMPERDGRVQSGRSLAPPRDLTTRKIQAADSRPPGAPDPLARLPSFVALPDDTVSAEHINFLSKQGALDIPTLALQRALIEAYIEFAYPYMPIIHLEEFLSIVNKAPSPLQKEGCTSPRISLILYQAVLFAGSAFVDTDLLQRESPQFSTRRLAREGLAKRVRLLYDLAPDHDAIVMIQAALLMSTWSDVPPDPKDSWYWMGLAISSAFAAGLNYDPAAHGMSSSHQKLRKRIWWTCYMRDRFLSLGLHRPTRIKDQEFSVPPLDNADFEVILLSRGDEEDVIGSNCPTICSVEDQASLTEICVYRTKLGVLIEAVLRLQAAYDNPGQQLVSSPDSYDRLEDQFGKVEEALTAWRASLPDSCLLQRDANGSEDGSKSLEIHRSHLHMMYHTLVYSLHRARFLPTSPRHLNPTPRLLSDISGAKVITSALNISGIVAALRRQGLDTYLPVSGVTIIFPAMVVSLLEMKCKDQALQRRAARRFSTCMRAMETLRETYTVAEVTMSYLNAALVKGSIDLSLWESSHYDDPFDDDDICDPAAITPPESYSGMPLDDIDLGDSASVDLADLLGETTTAPQHSTDKNDYSALLLDNFEIGDPASVGLSGLLDDTSDTHEDIPCSTVSPDHLGLDDAADFDLSALLGETMEAMDFRRDFF